MTKPPALKLADNQRGGAEIAVFDLALREMIAPLISTHRVKGRDHDTSLISAGPAGCAARVPETMWGKLWGMTRGQMKKNVNAIPSDTSGRFSRVIG
jgi:hypothetical protein